MTTRTPTCVCSGAVAASACTSVTSVSTSRYVLTLHFTVVRELRAAERAGGRAVPEAVRGERGAHRDRGRGRTIPDQRHPVQDPGLPPLPEGEPRLRARVSSRAGVLPPALAGRLRHAQPHLREPAARGGEHVQRRLPRVGGPAAAHRVVLPRGGAHGAVEGGEDLPEHGAGAGPELAPAGVPDGAEEAGRHRDC